MSHILLDEFKVYANIQSDVNTYDDLLNQLLFSIEDFLKNQYGIYLVKTNFKKYFDGNGKSVMYLPYSNIVVNELKIDDKLLNSSDYLVDEFILKLKNPLIFAQGFQNIYINFDVGYYVDDTSQIPQDLKLAIFILVNKLFENVKNNTDTIKTFSDPVSGRMQMLNSIPNEFFMVVNKYIPISL